MNHFLLRISTFICLLYLTNPSLLVCAKCKCETQYTDRNWHGALEYEVSCNCFNSLGKCIWSLFTITAQECKMHAARFCHLKAFAAGVILATGFIHILPEAFLSLSSPCLSEKSWGAFPFTGPIAMISCILTMLMEAFAIGYHKTAQLRKALPVDIREVEGESCGSDIGLQQSHSSDFDIRDRIVSQVLELGMIVHSAIIGISLGAAQNPKTIKPLTVALSFHQFFEGIGLGGCISQAKLKLRTIAIMVLLFSLTTPAGIAIGMIISKSYREHKPTSLILGGALNSASAGILIYMSLVDLLAADFINPRLQTNLKLQVGASISLLFGTGCMSLLAIWGT